MTARPRKITADGEAGSGYVIIKEALYCWQSAFLSGLVYPREFQSSFSNCLCSSAKVTRCVSTVLRNELTPECIESCGVSPTRPQRLQLFVLPDPELEP